MTNLTIGTVSILGKDYNKLIIQNITTITGTNSVVTSIPFFITNTTPSNGMVNYNPSGNGYRDTLVLTNPSSIEYNILISNLISTLGLTQSL